MVHLYILTGFAVILSFIANREKTGQAFHVAFKRLMKILPAMLVMLILVSLLPIQVSDAILVKYFGNHNKFFGVLFASLVGSITIMPGFIAFPLCGILLEKGVPYMVLSAFSTTLMMVGILTYPVEKTYLGHKVAILRNVISFGIAFGVAIMTGIFFGEVF